MEKRPAAPQNTTSTKRIENPSTPLRRGWTTGACATAATHAALSALLTGRFPDPVTITLPKGEMPSFALAHEELDELPGKAVDGEPKIRFAEAGIIKDAGDDPDVTHGAMVIARVQHGPPGSGIVFRAGKGVGIVTRPGLPIAVGQAAINPVPRSMMRQTVESICAAHALTPDIEITISIPTGETLALETWNPRLGIVGGLSILGTTGVVHPFSCSAWIHSIHRGIDVCRATGVDHVLGATGSTSQSAAMSLYDFPDQAILDMGDFAGGLLKYLRDHPIPRLTLAGGFAKFVKLAAGHLDLHSSDSKVDFNWLYNIVYSTYSSTSSKLNHNLKEQIQSANSALEVLDLTRSHGINLPEVIALTAQEKALATLRGAPVAVEVLIIARNGDLLARTGWKDGG